MDARHYQFRNKSRADLSGAKCVVFGDEYVRDLPLPASVEVRSDPLARPDQRTLAHVCDPSRSQPAYLVVHFSGDRVPREEPGAVAWAQTYVWWCLELAIRLPHTRLAVTSVVPPPGIADPSSCRAVLRANAEVADLLGELHGHVDHVLTHFPFVRFAPPAWRPREDMFAGSGRGLSARGRYQLASLLYNYLATVRYQESARADWSQYGRRRQPLTCMSIAQSERLLHVYTAGAWMAEVYAKDNASEAEDYPIDEANGKFQQRLSHAARRLGDPVVSNSAPFTTGPVVRAVSKAQCGPARATYERNIAAH